MNHFNNMNHFDIKVVAKQLEWLFIRVCIYRHNIRIHCCCIVCTDRRDQRDFQALGKLTSTYSRSGLTLLLIVFQVSSDEPLHYFNSKNVFINSKPYIRKMLEKDKNDLLQ